MRIGNVIDNPMQWWLNTGDLCLDWFVLLLIYGTANVSSIA